MKITMLNSTKKFLHFFKAKRSGDIARERLNRLLMSDRLSCSPVLVEHIREDIGHILNKYSEIDTSNIKIDIIYENKDSNLNPSLFIHIPFH